MGSGSGLVSSSSAGHGIIWSNVNCIHGHNELIPMVPYGNTRPQWVNSDDTLKASMIYHQLWQQYDMASHEHNLMS